MRPVREQLEHDRVIRLLQAKYKRKFDVAVNPGHTQVAPVGAGPNPWYPDLVLQAIEKNRKLQGVVEVETAESVNHLEAMSQWATFARLRVPFHLYVPASSVDSARRLCADLQIPADELWSYHAVGDQLRFALVQRSEAGEAAARAAANAGNHHQSSKAGKKVAAAASRRPLPKASKASKPAKPAAKANSKTASAARRKSPAARPAASKSSSRPAAHGKSSKRKS